MHRRAFMAILVLGGCSTNPVADVYDWAHPARGVCARANSSPGGVPAAAAGCPAAMNEDQNYRKGLLERFHRSRKPATGMPPNELVPVANP